MDHFDETPIHCRFIRNVRTEMKRQGLSMRTFAPKCGMGYVNLNRILCGHLDPPLTVCWRIAVALTPWPFTMFEAQYAPPNPRAFLTED
jgi:hypothetical protein